jgi:hypothetical protein
VSSLSLRMILHRFCCISCAFGIGFVNWNEFPLSRLKRIQISKGAWKTVPPSHITTSTLYCGIQHKLNIWHKQNPIKQAEKG